jgi:hypothetical protein
MVAVLDDPVYAVMDLNSKIMTGAGLAAVLLVVP